MLKMNGAHRNGCDGVRSHGGARDRDFCLVGRVTKRLSLVRHAAALGSTTVSACHRFDMRSRGPSSPTLCRVIVISRLSGGIMRDPGRRWRWFGTSEFRGPASRAGRAIW